MVDVQVWIVRTPSHHEIDERLEDAPLAAAVERPHGCVFRFASVAECDVTQQILEPALLHKRICFEIKEDISFGLDIKSTEHCCECMVISG